MTGGEEEDSSGAVPMAVYLRAMRALLLPFLLLCVFCLSCQDEDTDWEAPVNITFRKDRGCTYANDTVAAGDTLLVGVVATQGGSGMRWMRVYVAYDGGPRQRTDSLYINNDPFYLNKEIALRTVPGLETWTFNVLKANGDSYQRSLTFTVQ